jgi:DNA-binding response OmpR family regulator
VTVAHSVLILDDSATARLAIGAALRQRGFEVIPVAAVADLEAVLARSTPDLFLVDIHLTEMFGNDVVSWLREERHVDRPILLCSTRPDAELAQLAGECGADGYVMKQGGPEQVAARVARHLSGGRHG